MNLSTSCKDSDDDDCFFDVDAYVLEQLSKGSVKKAEEGLSVERKKERSRKGGERKAGEKRRAREN